MTTDPKSDESLRAEIDAKVYKARCESLASQLEAVKRQALVDAKAIRTLEDECAALRMQLAIERGGPQND